eukprot:201381_1
MGSTFGAIKLSFSLGIGNDDCLWVSKTINIAGHIIQEQYIHDWPKPNSKICAIVVNHVVWYGIHIIYYDQRSNKCIKSKITEVYNKKDITLNVNNIINCIQLSPKEPWQALYSSFNINRQPPFIVTRLYDSMKPSSGDMIRAYRGGSGIGFYHYGIYVSDDNIIHVTSPDPRNGIEFKRISAAGSITSGTVANACVQSTDWKTFVLNSTYVESIYTPLNYYSVETRIDNAIHAADNEALKGNYNVLDNNCEHFSRYILYGYRHSVQSDKINAVIRKNSAHVMDRMKNDSLLNEEEINNSYNEPTILVIGCDKMNDEKSVNVNDKKRKKKKKKRNVSKTDRL